MTLITQTEDQILTLTLNRPEVRNALTPDLQQSLIDALHAPEPTRVIILTGSPPAFCAGLDLSTPNTHPEQAAKLTATLFRTLYDTPIPTIAAVNGHAIAGGAGLATLCDFTLAVPEARFAYPEVKIGFIPALVSAYLNLQLGAKRATDLLLTGRTLTAQEALAYGLITAIVPAEELLSKSNTLARTLIQNSPTSLRATKALLQAQNAPWLDRALALAEQANAHARLTPDFAEGTRAFLEKRPPHWSS